MKKVMAVLAGLALMAPVAAMAVPTLTLTVDGFVEKIEDGSLKDLNILPNWVTYSGPVGPVWFMNVTTGQTQQAGTFMDLNSVDNTASTNAGDYPTTLKIDWTVPYNGTPVGTVQLGIGGTTIGSVVYSFAVNGVPVFTGGPLTGGTGDHFGAAGVAYFVPTGFADFSQIVEITHLKDGSTSFNYSGNPVPEPGTMLLIGSGLLGLGLIRRRMQVR